MDQTVDTIVDDTWMINDVPSTSSQNPLIIQSSEPLQPSASTSYDIQTLAIETNTGKRLRLEEPQNNNSLVIKDPMQNVSF